MFFVPYVNLIIKIQPILRGNCFLFKKQEDFSLNMEILKSWKKWTPDCFSTISVSLLVNRRSSKYLWFIWRLCRNIHSPLLNKTCYLITVWGLWGFYILRSLILSIYKCACSTDPPPLSYLGKKLKQLILIFPGHLS